MTEGAADIRRHEAAQQRHQPQRPGDEGPVHHQPARLPHRRPMGQSDLRGRRPRPVGPEIRLRAGPGRPGRTDRRHQAATKSSASRPGRTPISLSNSRPTSPRRTQMAALGEAPVALQRERCRDGRSGCRGASSDRDLGRRRPRTRWMSQPPYFVGADPELLQLDRDRHCRRRRRRRAQRRRKAPRSWSRELNDCLASS